jgi:hypothetical protein
MNEEEDMVKEKEALRQLRHGLGVCYSEGE